MPIERVFLNVVVDDLQAAPRLYEQLLGFRRAFTSDWFVQLRAPGDEGPEIGFLHRDSDVVPAAARAAPVGGLLTIVVDDVDDVHRRAMDAGFDVIEPPRALFYGQKRLLLRDDSGLTVDVSSECEPDPAWMKRVRQTPDGFAED